MPAALIPRDEVVKRLMNVFRTSGYDGATLARFSEATGLGKASLYHYFPGGKEDMANAVLDLVEDWMRENVHAPLAGSRSPERRIKTMLRKVDGLYESGDAPCLLGALVVGDSKHVFQKRLRSIFSGWIEALAKTLQETGLNRAVAREKAEDAVIRIEGALIVSSGVADTTPFRRLLKQLPKELLG